MDILQKKTVKELKSILREYKKIHCRPYSRLKKAQMIELIKYHGISEHDIEKTGKINSAPKPKSTPKPKLKPKSEPKTENKEPDTFGSNMSGSFEKQLKDMEDNINQCWRDYKECINKVNQITEGIRRSNLYRNNKTEAQKIENRIERLLKRLELAKKMDHDKGLMFYHDRKPEERTLTFSDVLHAPGFTQALKKEQEIKQKKLKSMQRKINKVGAEIRKQKREQKQKSKPTPKSESQSELEKEYKRGNRYIS